MKKKQRRYVSYLLRMWRVRSHGQGFWRASLEYPQTGQVIGFPDLESLFSFLLTQTENGQKGDDPTACGVDDLKTT